MPKAAEYRELKNEELDARLESTRQELFNLRFRHATGQLDNSSRLGQVRKEVARLATLVREREIAAAEEREG